MNAAEPRDVVCRTKMKGNVLVCILTAAPRFDFDISPHRSAFTFLSFSVCHLCLLNGSPSGLQVARCPFVSYRCVPALPMKRLTGANSPVFLRCFRMGTAALGFRPHSPLRNASEPLSHFRNEFSVRRNGMFGPPRG